MTRSLDGASASASASGDDAGGRLRGAAGPTVVRVPETLRRCAASRLYQGPRAKRLAAADSLLRVAASHGIRPELMWATLSEPGSTEPVRQMVMGVPGTGRTAMLFLTPPGPTAALGDADNQHLELTACVETAVAELAAAGLGVRLIQVLPEPSETWSIRACVEAGMTEIGELAYMRRPYGKDASADDAPWPDVVEVRALAFGERRGSLSTADTAALTTALDASYVRTLDCPELCGLRRTEDVIASHMSTGVFNPETWWLVSENNEPAGCVLMSHCPDHDSVELVYLGLAPSLRGRGLGATLLRAAIVRTARFGAQSVTCAVDRRNAPAMALYERLGFRVFANRVAIVAGTA